MTTFNRVVRSALVLSLIASATLLASATMSSSLSAAEPAKKPVRKTVRKPYPLTDPKEQARYREELMLEARVSQGRELFHREWKPRDAGSGISGDGFGDGLGPLFNERSCVACHKLGGTGGAGPAENNVVLLVAERLPAGDKWETTHLAQRSFLLPTATSDTFLLHRFGTSPDYERWRQERLSLVTSGASPAEAVSEAARAKHLYLAGLELELVPNIHNEGDDKFVPAKPTFVKLLKEERNTTALFGVGLIGAVDEKTLEAIALEQEPAVRGRVPYTPNRLVGRFGWKGQNSSLLEFNAGACAAELGLDTAGIRQAKAPLVGKDVKPLANQFNISKGVDISADEIQAMTDYVASIPAPRRVPQTKKLIDVRAGEEHFATIGCAVCHRPKVGEVEEIYSDLLLHSVGISSSSGNYYGSPVDVVDTRDPKRSAGPEEFRTPPLWGVADSAPYLHDGRAETLKDAIVAHGGQARSSSQRFTQLSHAQQQQVLTFLGSLKATQ